MGRIQKQISMPQEDVASWEQICQPYGGVSKFNQLIAKGQLICSEPWSSQQQQALLRMLTSLTESGAIEDAVVLGELMLSQLCLESAIRTQVEVLMGGLPQWVAIARELIAQHQAFQLTTGHNHIYTIRYAKFVRGDRRSYLMAWCEEPTETEPPQTSHTRSFRLDKPASIAPIQGEWRYQGLDKLQVELHFVGELAKNYTPKAEDISVGIVDGKLRVIKEVVSAWWLLQDVMRYLPECIVMQPTFVRDTLLARLAQSQSAHTQNQQR